MKYKKTVNQDLGGPEIPQLIWLGDILSNNTTGNIKGGSITVPLTSCLTGLD